MPDRINSDTLWVDQDHPADAMPAVLAVYFALFLFCASFSIAASQTILGLSMIVFLITLTRQINRAYLQPLHGFFMMVGIYMLWMVVSALFGESPFSSIWALREEWLFITVLVSACLFRDRRYAEHLVLAMAIGLLMVALYGIIQAFTGVHWFRSSPLTLEGPLYRASGNFSHPLTYGNFVVITTLFLLGYVVVRFREMASKRRVLLAAAVIVGIVVISLLNSRGPMLAALCGLLFLGLITRKLKYILPVLVVAMAIGWFAAPALVDNIRNRVKRDLTASDSRSRLFIWNNVLRIIADHPMTGIGSANFGEEYMLQLGDDTEAVRVGHAHSDYFNVTVLYGFPGLLLFLGVWYFALRNLWRGYRHSRSGSPPRGLSLGALLASVAFLVSALTEATFADEEVRQVLMAIWGAGFSALQSSPLSKVSEDRSDTTSA